MGATSGDLEHLQVRLEALALEEMRDRRAQAGGGELVDPTAGLADQECDEVVAAVLVRAGDEGVAARKPVHQPLLDEEVEGSVDGDRRKPPGGGGGKHVGHIVGAERPVRRVERLEHRPANGRQAHALVAAGRLGAGKRLRPPGVLVFGMRAGSLVAMIVHVLVMGSPRPLGKASPKITG